MNESSRLIVEKPPGIVQETLVKWAESHSYKRRGCSGKHYLKYVCHIMNMFDDRVRNCACEWVAPYGRVISADCELHD